MGILVSWINTAWSIADAHPIGHEPLDEDGQPSLLRQDHHNPRPTPAALTGQPTSVPTSIPSIETPAPPSPRGETGASSALFAPSVGAVNNRQQHLCVSSDYDENDRRVSMAEGTSSSNSRSDNPLVPPSSPPPTCSPGLRIDVVAANDPTLDHEMTDASFINAAGVPDASTELYFDDEGLSTLEKIYLFARSAASFHRVFISRSLPSFLSDVSPCEAIEYVIPLMNGLAMDEDEAVKEALVEDLVSIIWWFLTRCQVVEQDVPEGAGSQEVPLLNVQSFTPLLGTLLLNPRANVNAPARHCVVNLLARIREADSDDTGYFGPTERKLFEHELIQHVVIGMAHLDNESPAAETDESSLFQQESLAEQSDTSSIEFMNPPPSAADDSVLLSTLTSSVHALATTQFLAQEEPLTPTVATIAAAIQRPPSPIPTVQSNVPIPEYEPEFAHIVSRPVADESLDSEHMVDRGSPMSLVPPLPTSAAEPMQNSRSENAGREQDMQGVSQTQIQAPRPEHLPEGDTLNMTGESAQLGEDIGDVCSDFNEEQAAIGKLASMSLIAAVTASGSLDREFQSAFVEEVKRAGHDSIYWVRREATFALGALAKVVPEELLHVSLLPLFDFFCEDSVWNVRQSVLFALPAILSRLPSDSRRIRALRTIQKLSIDPSPQVRTGVLEVLGEVIYSFHEDDKGPPAEIIRLFVGEEGRDWHAPDSPALQTFADAEARRSWAHPAFRSDFPTGMNDVFGPSQQSVSSVSTPVNHLLESDPARSLICAFNLPAVTLTLGPSRWHELRGLYLFLVRTGAPKVRQTLAASIGEVAKIIGPENARRDLLYCWWDFARGRDSSVRTKALEALEVFLQELNIRERERIIESLEELWDDHMKSWREREIFARSLDRLALLFPSNGAVLRSLLRRALRDPVAAVRNAAIEAYPQIYGYTLSHPEALKLITGEVVALAYDGSFKNRLTYVECARSLITADSSYDRFMDESFWQFVVVLASDKIADVRIGLARLLSIACEKILTKQRTLPGGVLNIVRTLSEDKVADVRAFVSHILPPDGEPPTERAYGHISEIASSMATFSRPPPQREPKTLAAGINDMTIEDTQNYI